MACLPFLERDVNSAQGSDKMPLQRTTAAVRGSIVGEPDEQACWVNITEPNHTSTIFFRQHITPNTPISPLPVVHHIRKPPHTSHAFALIFSASESAAVGTGDAQAGLRLQMPAASGSGSRRERGWMRSSGEDADVNREEQWREVGDRTEGMHAIVLARAFRSLGSEPQLQECSPLCTAA